MSNTATAPTGLTNPERVTPLTSISEDEQLFRNQVRQFAEETVKPKVKEMDEKGVFDRDLIKQFFELGLMGIEVPAEFGGSGGTFFESIIAVEEMSRVDPSAGVIVRRCCQASATRSPLPGTG